MITFLPYEDFAESAVVLDRARLGNQRSEVLGILKTIAGTYGTRWVDSPAVKMWRGHEKILMFYGMAICDEWIRRGYTDNMKGRIIDEQRKWWGSEYPWWLGHETLHLSHKSNLIRKKPDHYGLFWPDVPNDLRYAWPVW